MRAMQFRVALIAGLGLVTLSITPGAVPMTAQGQAAQRAVETSSSPSAPLPPRTVKAAVKPHAPAGRRTVKAPLTPIVANGSWPTYHRDNARTGNDPTLPAVTTVTAGWTSAVLDGQVYASPLVYGGIVYAATLNNTVYALNQTDGSLIWSTHLRTPESGGWGCGNVSPQGILGTPVIDPTGGRIYVATLAGNDDLYRVEGLNLLTGVEQLNTTIPVNIGLGFDWTIQQQRGALSVANGYVYVPFGGRAGDCGNYSGWVVGVPTNGTTGLHVYQTPGIGNGIWDAGGIAVDDSTGNIFAATGNGDIGSGCNAVAGGAPQFENDAVVRLSPTLAEQDFFMPPDWEFNWCKNDQDLGSAAPMLISPSVLFQAGKWGTGFLLNPANLGGVGGQRFPTPKPAVYSEANVCFGNNSDATFGSFAYASPFIYLECEGQGLVALRVNTSVPSLPTFTPCDTCAAPDWNAGGSTTFGPPIVAAGAVWVASNSGLFAYGAATGALIYHSATFGINRFVTPAEAGCKVFVPSHTVIRSFVMHFASGPSCPAPSVPRPAAHPQSVAPTPTSRAPANQSLPGPTPPPR
jgi:polyvinyl alcohol dehydrogenase (cytochrome)